jgi:hypothetical protein
VLSRAFSGKNIGELIKRAILCLGEGSAWTGAEGKSAIPQPKPIKAFSFCDPAKKVSLCSTRTQKLADNLQATNCATWPYYAPTTGLHPYRYWTHR